MVLVTGAAGYIGSHLLRAMQAQGLGFVALDNLSSGQRSSLPDACEFVEGDIRDQKLVAEVIRAISRAGGDSFGGTYFGRGIGC